MRKIGFYILLMVFITIISLSTVNADDLGHMTIDESSNDIQIHDSAYLDSSNQHKSNNLSSDPIDLDKLGHSDRNEKNKTDQLEKIDELNHSDETDEDINLNKIKKSNIEKDPESMENSDYGGKIIEITEENYGDYFDRFTGELLSENTVNNGDIIKIGNVSNKIFTFNKKLYITSISDNDTILNGRINLLKGSDGSTVTNLKIYNDVYNIKIKGVNVPLFYGFFLNHTNNNTISFNTFHSTSEVGFAFYAYNSSYNNIVYNSFHTGDSNDESTSCFVMDLSDYNIISYNDLQTIQSNVIYFNHYGWAGARDVCTGNYISNNYIYTENPSPMSYGMQIVYGYHNGTSVINNTINSVAQAINLNGENITIYGNRISNITECGINSDGINSLIEKNTITADYPIHTGIDTIGRNITISSNEIRLNNGSSFGIRASENSSCENNIINMGSFGTGIIVQKDNNRILNNTIVTIKDSAISIKGSNNTIQDNSIDSNVKGIEIRSPSNRISNNSIIANRINSDDYGIYINGLIYNSRIGNNIIVTNASQGIYRKVSDEISDELFDNIINGIITDPTAITVNNSNFYDYFDENGYLNFTFKEGVNGVIFLSYLSNKNLRIDEKLYFMSNNNNNYLYNVTIDLLKGSEGSIIKDLNFYNVNNTDVIRLNSTDNIIISGNNISLICENYSIKNNFSSIRIDGNCQNIEILDNNIYLRTLNNSNDSRTYGILINEIDDLSNISSDNISKENNSEDNSTKENDPEGNIIKTAVIQNNNIVIYSDSIIEGIGSKSISNAQINNNYISLLSSKDIYGININKLNESQASSNSNINENTIIIYSKGNSYPILINNISDSAIEGNIIYSNATKTKGILINQGLDLSLNRNELSLFENKNETNQNIINSSAIELSKDSKRCDILENIIDTNINKIFILNTHAVKMNLSSTRYIIGDYNFLNYFTNTSDGILNNSISKNDFILFKNLSSVKSFSINIPLDISSYSKDSAISAIITLNSKAAKSKIHDLTFDNRNTSNGIQIILNNTKNVEIFNNLFRLNGLSCIINNVNGNDYTEENKELKENSNGIIIIEKGKNNSIHNNDIIINGSLSEETDKTVYGSNINQSSQEANLSSEEDKNTSSEELLKNINKTPFKFLVINNSSDNSFVENNINCEVLGIFNCIELNHSTKNNISKNNVYSKSIIMKFLDSNSSNRTIMESNNLEIYSSLSFGYYGNNTHKDSLINNNIRISNENNENSESDIDYSGILNGMEEYYFVKSIDGNQTGIYCIDSNEILISLNHVESLDSDDDYAIYIDSPADKIEIINNYLISDNNERLADSAVYHINSIVHDNTPYAIYVSLDGEDKEGNGDKDHPYHSLEFAIANSFDGMTIYLYDGNYSASNIIIDKDITISAMEGNRDNLTEDVDEDYSGEKRVIINLEKNQLFSIDKNAQLIVKGIEFTNGNSINGTVFFNEGNLTIINSSFINNTALNIDNQTVTGFGAVATNYGNLSIINSEFYNNRGHKGGVIMNYGNIIINDSEFINNSAVSGAVIYNDDDSNTSCEFYNSSFASNKAINDFGFCKVHMDYNQIKSDCCDIGSGGVIYSKNNSTIIIDSCNFKNNSAANGGVIFTNGSLKEPNSSVLKIRNSEFESNTASKSGGAIFSINNETEIYSSNFTKNEANQKGGAIYAVSAKGTIDSSKLINNIAEVGGALDCNGNFVITNTIISNNTASNGGGINYKGDKSYGHITNHMLIYNSTIENNRGLNTGGGFQLESGNITIADSNIVNNYAPKDSTITTRGSGGYFSADNNNWWGSTKGPSDDVWNYDVNHLEKRNWAKSEVQWNQNPNNEDGGKSNPEKDQNKGHNPISPFLPGGTDHILVPIINPNPGDGHGNNGGSHSGNNSGNGSGGNGTGGDGNGNGDSETGGNGSGNSDSQGETGSGYQTGAVKNSNSNSQNNRNTNATSNGQSTSDNSTSNPELTSVGTTGNNPGTSSQGGESSSSSPKAYKISEDNPIVEKSSDITNMAIIIGLFLILLIIGYKREKDNDKDKK